MTTEDAPDSALHTLTDLWADFELPAATLDQLTLTGPAQPLASSFSIGPAAQASTAAAAAAALLIYEARCGTSQRAVIDSIKCALECTGLFKIDGVTPDQWAPLSGLYRTADGYIRIHANFDHHRDAALAALKLPIGESTVRQQANDAAIQFSGEQLDIAITRAGGACSVLQSFAQWDSHPQALALSSLPLIELTKIADADPIPLPHMDKHAAPLNGIRILDLTRILAGPVCGRTLAAYGADVMLINSPNLPNIDAIMDTSRGKLSALVDLQTPAGKTTIDQLLKTSRVLVQGYRPGALAGFGLSAEALAEKYPGIITTSLSAYGRNGPWSERRGFDSLVQTSTGFNVAEADAFGQSAPKPMPVQILDYATGFLMAFASQIALYKQSQEGGSWHVQLSLAKTGMWLRSMGQSLDTLQINAPLAEPQLRVYPSKFGQLEAINHAADFSMTPVNWKIPSAPPGTHQPQWQQN